MFLSFTRRAVARVLIATTIILVAGAAAAAEWIDSRQVGPFVIRAAFDLTPHEATLNELVALELELRRVLALRPCTEPVTVLIAADEPAYRDLLAREFPEAPYRRALFVREQGRATVFAYRHDELAIDLRHECTHALLHADLPVLPLWLDEGLAEYFEMPAAQRAFGHPHGDALRLNMWLGYVRGLPALEAKHELADMTGSDYQYAWAWTHFLLHGPRAGTEQLWAYLGNVRRGEPPGILSDRIERALPGANRRLVSHFRHWPRRQAAAPPVRR